MKIESNYFKNWAASLVMATMLVSCFGNKNTKEELPVVAFKQEPGKLLILINKKPFATYVYEDSVTTRPYFENVMTPCGVQATRKYSMRCLLNNLKADMEEEPLPCAIII